jgi:hypothetical protein
MANDSQIDEYMFDFSNMRKCLLEKDEFMKPTTEEPIQQTFDKEEMDSSLATGVSSMCQ